MGPYMGQPEQEDLNRVNYGEYVELAKGEKAGPQRLCVAGRPCGANLADVSNDQLQDV